MHEEASTNADHAIMCEDTRCIHGLLRRHICVLSVVVLRLVVLYRRWSDVCSSLVGLVLEGVPEVPRHIVAKYHKGPSRWQGGSTLLAFSRKQRDQEVRVLDLLTRWHESTFCPFRHVSACSPYNCCRCFSCSGRTCCYQKTQVHCSNACMSSKRAGCCYKSLSNQSRKSSFRSMHARQLRRIPRPCRKHPCPGRSDLCWSLLVARTWAYGADDLPRASTFACHSTNFEISIPPRAWS